MPSTPQVQGYQSETVRQPHNGLAQATNLPIHAKSPMQSIKADANGYPLTSVISSLSDSDTKDRGASPRKMSVPIASTSQLPVPTVERSMDMKQEDRGRNGTGDTTADQHFRALFKTRRTRAWEKSRKIDDDDELAITEEELMKQLRPEEEGLVPLNAIAGRLVLYAWQLFANQVEINPSISPLKRRKPIYYDAHEARKQLIKLLVLVQWSKVAPELNLARSLIAFINDHFVQTDAAITSLSETRSILTNARLRKYDLATAIEVLGTSSPQRLPQILWETAKGQKRFSDEEAISIVKQLDETIRFRLACEEVVPLALAAYTVSDGRASFRVPTLFQAEITLSGDGVEDRWWLLKVTFDFTVTGTGSDRFPRYLGKQQRLQLLSMADIELAPRSVAAIAEEEMGEKADDNADTEMKDVIKPLSKEDEGKRVERKDAPLIRLYNFLQSQALHYRLDILHYQVLQLKKLDWGDFLSTRMEVIESTRVLHIAYWQSTRAVAESTWMPTSGGHLRISVGAQEDRIDFESVIKHVSITDVDDDDDQYRRGQTVERLEMIIDWITSGPSEEFIASTELQIDPHELDVSTLMCTVTQRHAVAALQAIRKYLLASTLKNPMPIENVLRTDIEGCEEPCLLLRVCEQAAVILKVDSRSGRIKLEEDLNIVKGRGYMMPSSNSAWRKRLQEATDRINERSDQAVQILLTIRTRAILEDLEEKCHLLGIPVTSRLPLRQIDYDTLQARIGTLLYMTLGQSPGYHLFVHVGEDSIRIGVISVGTFLEDASTSMRIVSLEWLDWHRILDLSQVTLLRKRSRYAETAHLNSFERQSISKVEVSKIYSYGIALICYHKIEQQLQARNVPFKHVGGVNSLRPPMSFCGGIDDEHSIERIVPSLCVDAVKLLASDSKSKSELRRNIHIQLCHWEKPAKAHVAFSIKLKNAFNFTSDATILENAQEKIYHDTEKGILTFSYQDLGTCVDRFIKGWTHIAKILHLSKELREDGQTDFFTRMQCNLLQVQFYYGKSCLAQIRWVHSNDAAKKDSFTLSFEGNEDNPHQLIRSYLNSWLNKFVNTSTFEWKRILLILRQTYHVLSHLHQISKNANEKIECLEIQVQSASHFTLVFWNDYRLDIRLVKGNKILFCDCFPQCRIFSGTRQDLQSDIKDEFTMDSSTSNSPPLSVKAQPKDTSDRIISPMSAIFSEVHKAFQQEAISRPDKEQEVIGSLMSRRILVFPNGLICVNDAEILDWIFPRLIQRIQDSIDS